MNVADVREALKQEYRRENFVHGRGGDTVEIVGASFTADEETMFGKLNLDYVKNERQTAQEAPRGPETVTAAPYWLPMASNVVAHAIAAGLIKEPSDIKKWVFGAMNAAKGAAEGDIGV